MTEYSDVSGILFRVIGKDSEMLTGVAEFRPRQRTYGQDDTVYYLSPMSFSVSEGMLIGAHGAGVSIPADDSGLVWDVIITVEGYPRSIKFVIQSFTSGSIILGD